MAKADSQIAACSPSFGCAGKVDTSFHVERYRSDVTRGAFYHAHPFSLQVCSGRQKQGWYALPIGDLFLIVHRSPGVAGTAKIRRKQTSMRECRISPEGTAENSPSTQCWVPRTSVLGYFQPVPSGLFLSVRVYPRLSHPELLSPSSA